MCPIACPALHCDALSWSKRACRNELVEGCLCGSINIHYVPMWQNKIKI